MKGMRIIILILLFCINYIKITHSQTHQIYGSVGYNIPTATTVVGKIQNSEDYKISKAGFNKGIVLQAGYTYGINDNFQIDINAGYLFDAAEEIYYSSVQYFVIENEQTIERKHTRSFSSSNFNISPSIIVNTKYGNFIPYLKFGGSINFIRITDKWINPPYESQTDPFRNRDRGYNYNFKGDFILGWLAGIGINYILESSILFVELQLNSLTFYPDEVEFNGFNYELESELDPYQYAKNYNPVRDFAFSSFGILAGIRLVL